MREEWWERPSCFICDYWWIILLALILGLVGYFTRDLWSGLLGFQDSQATLYPTQSLGTGDVQVTLIWNTKDDLDLWVTDPEGYSIGYSSRNSPTGGELDVDANAGCVDYVSNSPIENIFWPDGAAPFGEYIIKVNYFANCGSIEPISYIVRVKVDGDVKEYQGVIEKENEDNLVANFVR